MVGEFTKVNEKHCNKKTKKQNCGGPKKQREEINQKINKKYSVLVFHIHENPNVGIFTLAMIIVCILHCRNNFLFMQ